MNNKKSLSEQPWLQDELKALRAEEPDSTSVDLAVERVLDSPVKANRTRPRMVWRAAAVLSASGALAVLLTVQPFSANAAGLRRVASALRAQHTRYLRGYRPDANGKLILTNEIWLENDKQLSYSFDADGNQSTVGYDGHRMFVSYPKSDGFVDDVAPSGFPIEDIDAYLSIPGGKILKVTNVSIDGKKLTVYSLGFKFMKFDLFIDPVTGLPVQRDVLNLKGHLIEHDDYEYPADIPDSKFSVPQSLAGKLCDYTQMRSALARMLERPGQTQVVGGVKVTLHGVIVGRSKLLVLMTGGARAEYLKGGSLLIEGYDKPITDGRPTVFNVGTNDTSEPTKPTLFLHGQPLLGDGAWFADLKSLKAPFTIDVAVWKEDRSRPATDRFGKPAGYHSLLAGRAKFKVTVPLFADDPERVLWKPDESAQIAMTSSK